MRLTQTLFRPLNDHPLLLSTLFLLTGAALQWRLGWAPQAVALVGFAWVLLVLAAIDWRSHRLPDTLTLPLLWAGLVLQLLPPTRTVGAELAIAGAVVGYLPLRALELAYFKVRRIEALGFGDLKLLAAIGAWLGPQAVMLVFVAAALVGSAWQWLRSRGRTAEVPQQFALGPWLVASTLALLLAGPAWMGWGAAG
jgi:leader peptidase (prepilin peptidase)/N-methyltransferase